MNEALTPRQIGRAIEVSESSIKRWCDQGKIKASYTAGGHRRIRIADFLNFIKTHKQDLVRPEAIGLPPNIGRGDRSLDRSQTPFQTALLSGDEQVARQIIFDLFLAEYSLARLCDDVFSVAFDRIGDLWYRGEAKVYEERRALEIGRRLLDELRSMVVAPLENAPIAIGGTPIGDHYTLPTQMVELVLKDLRWKPTSLGCNLPLSSMSQAIQDYRPRVFWLIVSHIDNAETLIADYRQLHGLFSGRCEFILCGKGITPALLSQMPCAAYCQSFQQIVDYVQRRFGV